MVPDCLITRVRPAASAATKDEGCEVATAPGDLTLVLYNSRDSLATGSDEGVAGEEISGHTETTRG